MAYEMRIGDDTGTHHRNESDADCGRNLTQFADSYFLCSFNN